MNLQKYSAFLATLVRLTVALLVHSSMHATVVLDGVHRVVSEISFLDANGMSHYEVEVGPLSSTGVFTPIANGVLYYPQGQSINFLVGTFYVYALDFVGYDPALDQTFSAFTFGSKVALGGTNLPGTFVRTVSAGPGDCSPEVLEDITNQHTRRSTQGALFKTNVHRLDGGLLEMGGTVTSYIRTPDLSNWFVGSEHTLIGGYSTPSLAGVDPQSYYNPVYLARKVQLPNGSATILGQSFSPPFGFLVPLREFLNKAGYSHIETSGQLGVSFLGNWELSSRGDSAEGYEIRYLTTVRLQIEGLPISSQKECEVIYRYNTPVNGRVVDGNADFRDEFGNLPKFPASDVILRTVDGSGFDNWSTTSMELVALAELLSDRFAAYARASGRSGTFRRAPSILAEVYYFGSGSANTPANHFHGKCDLARAQAERGMDLARLGPAIAEPNTSFREIDLRIPCADFDRTMALYGDLDFGAVPVGQSETKTLKIFNWGNVPLVVNNISSADPRFTVSYSGTIAQMQGVDVTVTFTPDAAGEFRSALSVASNTTGPSSARLAKGRGIVAGATSLSTQSLHYSMHGGTRAVLVSGAPSWTVSNSNNWIQVSPNSGAGATQVEVFVSQNTGPSTRSAQILVGDQTLSIVQSGVATGPAIEIDGPVHFGSVPVGVEITQSIRVTNRGNAPLIVSSVSYPNEFVFGGDWSGGTIAPGNWQDINIRFSPQSSLHYGGTLTINSNKTEGENLTVISGQGVSSGQASPAVVAHPANQNVTMPASATFSVSATGENLSYQWQFRTSASGSWTNLSGATSNSYNTGATTTAMNGYQYRCRVSNSGGTVDSNPAMLTITPAIDSMPIISGFIPNQRVVAGEITQLDLADFFDLPGIYGQILMIRTTSGNFNIELFSDVAPLTVENFLSYVNSGAYQNTVFHRSIPGFVIQAGGFTATMPPQSITPGPPIPNEFQVSNTRGMVAMAKLSGDPDSATSQWFINLDDNSENLNFQNGGFTVFARVLGTGMDIVDSLAAVPVYDAGSPFDSIPLQGIQESQSEVGLENFVRVLAVEQLLIFPTVDQESSVITFHVESSQPDGILAYMSGSHLLLERQNNFGGPATIAVSAVDTNGNSVHQAFYVPDEFFPTQLPDINLHPANQTVTEPEPATFSVSASGSGLSYQWQFRTSASGSWTNLSGATSNSYNTGATTTAMNGYQYRCLVSNAGGTVESGPAALTVTTPSAPDPAPVIQVSGNLDFGPVQVGQEAVRQLLISNQGNAALDISGISGGSASFLIQFSGTIQPQQQQAVNLIFRPQTVGSHSATLQVLSNAGVAGIQASGAGVQGSTEQTDAEKVVAALKSYREYVGLIGPAQSNQSGGSASAQAGTFQFLIDLAFTLEEQVVAYADRIVVVLGGTRYNSRWQKFSDDGSELAGILWSRQGPTLTYSLQTRLDGSVATFSGEITDGQTTWPVELFPKAFTGKGADVSPLSGVTFNNWLEAGPENPAQLGHGFFSMLFARNGSARVVGRTPDNAALTGVAWTVLTGEDAPAVMLVANQGKSGVLAMLAALDSSSAFNATLSGDAVWFRDANWRSAFHLRQPIAAEFQVAGMPWVSPMFRLLQQEDFTLATNLGSGFSNMLPPRISGLWPATNRPVLSQVVPGVKVAFNRQRGLLTIRFPRAANGLRMQALCFPVAVEENGKKIQAKGFVVGQPGPVELEVP